MKKSFIIVLFSIVSMGVQAQRGPLRGTGNLLTKVFDYQEFDKVYFEDLDGKIDVEVGKSFSIKVEIDENLASLLEVEKESRENSLRIALKGNRNNRMYVEDTRISIKITLPEASVIKHRGNSSLRVVGIVGRYFRLELEGNGTATLAGKTDELDITKNGNGSVKAQALVAQTAKVKSYGNGNVYVNSRASLDANGMGNGLVLQTGAGQISASSGIVGNGSVRKE